jgi:hypothetical protein
MKDKTNTNLVIRSSVALALALAIWSPVHAQSLDPAEGKTMTATTMMQHCQEMKAQKRRLKEDTQVQNAQLTEQLANMNRAPEDQKTGLIAAVLTHVVEQRIAMDARKAKMDEAMMQHMQMSQGIHVAMPDDDRNEGHERQIGERLQGTTQRAEMIAQLCASAHSLD